MSWLANDGKPRPVIGGPDAAAGTQPAPAYQRRDAPVYQPRAGQTGQSYSIPLTPGQNPAPVPIGGVWVTYEIYGRLNGRQVPLWQELRFDEVRLHIQQGGRILISHSAAEGYGFGGMPDSWTKLYGSRSPTDWGLDPDKGLSPSMGRVPTPSRRHSWSRFSGRIGGGLFMSKGQAAGATFVPRSTLSRT